MNRNETFLFEQIAESIRLQIMRGDLQPGAKLPSIRNLAEQWHCTPGTIVRAYSALADEGLVASRRGAGTRVAEQLLPSQPLILRSAMLINQVEGLFLSLLGQGYNETQVESAFGETLSRWHRLREQDRLSEKTRQEGYLRFVGSHDLTLDILKEMLETSGSYHLDISYRGSLGGLIALARDEADIAGSHLWDEQSGDYNTPYVQRILPGQRTALVTVAGRSFGLMLPPGNPQGVKSLADISREDVIWVNRQAGSGTRVWLDAQLRQYGIHTAEIEGYENAKTTHVEVAEAVRDGAATAGLGIYAATAAYGLDFMPCAHEQYQLVIPETVFESAVCRALLDVVQSAAFKESINVLGGYQTAVTGQITWIQ